MNSLIDSQVFGIDLMKSGRLCLNLTSCVDWEQFPEYAEALVSILDATIQKKVDSFDIRIWEISIRGELVRLVFDDFPVMISLESISETGDTVLVNVKSYLEVEAG